MAIIIKNVKGFKFALTDGTDGYAFSTGFGFYDTETKEWISGNDAQGSTEFPYIPAGGRNACKQIMADSGDFFKLQPHVKSLN